MAPRREWTLQHGQRSERRDRCRGHGKIRTGSRDHGNIINVQPQQSSAGRHVARNEAGLLQYTQCSTTSLASWFISQSEYYRISYNKQNTDDFSFLKLIDLCIDDLLLLKQIKASLYYESDYDEFSSSKKPNSLLVAPSTSKFSCWSTFPTLHPLN